MNTKQHGNTVLSLFRNLLRVIKYCFQIEYSHIRYAYIGLILYIIIHIGIGEYQGLSSLWINNCSNTEAVFFCTEEISAFLAIVEFLLIGAFLFLLSDLFIKAKKRKKLGLEVYVLFPIIGHLSIIILSYQGIGPFQNISEYTPYFGKIFCFSILAILTLLLLGNEKPSLQKKAKEGEQEDSNIIRKILPILIDDILEKNFRLTGKGLISIKEVIEKDSEHLEIRLKINDSLLADIRGLQGFDWEQAIAARGQIFEKRIDIIKTSENFYKKFKVLRWVSDKGVNALLVKRFKKTISLKGMFYYPHLLEKSPLIQKPLDVPLGITEHGNDLTINITTLPHLLVAGETQGGKSVGINVIIISILKAIIEWDNIELTIIDPKRLDFSIYKGIYNVHVESNIKKSIQIMEETVKEMYHRYDVLEKFGIQHDTIIKNIKQYNEGGGDMNYKVIVVDEFNDIMTEDKEIAGKFEHCVKKMAQLSRAVGIHIVIATQNPTVEVVNTQIKGNLPARLGFRTAAAVNSRTIMDDSVLSTIKYKGECYLKTGEKGLQHLKTYFINEDNGDLLQFVKYYQEHTKTQKSAVLHSQKNDDFHNINEYIIKTESHIDTHSKGYKLFKYIIDNKGYSNRKALETFCSSIGIYQNTVRIIIKTLKEGEYITDFTSSKTGKYNKLNESLIQDIESKNYESLVNFYYIVNKSLNERNN